MMAQDRKINLTAGWNFGIIKVQSGADIVIESIENLSLFLDEVNILTKDLFVRATSSNDLNVITEFTKSVLKYALKYDIKYMKEYSESLLEKIDIFEIDSISSMLKSYEEKIIRCRDRKFLCFSLI